MNTTLITYIGTGLFLFIFLSGFWLSRSGKPYSTLIFTIHKLIGLTMGIFLIITVYRATSLDPAQIVAIAITVLLFFATVAAGGLLSIEKPIPLIVSVIHKVLPYFTVISTAGTLSLFLP